METSAETEAALLELAKSGDERAFGELVQAHRGELRTHCYRILGSVQDAEDAVQNALLRAAAVTAFIVGDEPDPVDIFASFGLPGEPA